ncbi:Trehalose and maltose hydrolase (possible phosphorylase) [Actinacidiphila yanglinensis]|uniref:Trehalose and maltose hydrolase (Possible phosphorylase) n=1 Tax=Actinacidiphila yanglinensis TaxID=310779 RepID=A0A1H6D7B8_9ACTN|nr:glycoside hydrolase family 65 protein [Actinacidiphila yanglinensis]SEG81249.1 Trehalose and maltose hydrolase (possible phosphorylase) [Actinacidiphila yanglinensis]
MSPPRHPDPRASPPPRTPVTERTPAQAGWSWAYEGYDPSRERLREALCTLGNGYFATRGAAAEAVADRVHHPGTYVAGCYDRLVSEVDGHEVENEDMVNLPNWLPLRVRAADGAWFSPDTCSVLGHEQVLDLRRGTLRRRMRLRDAAGRQVALEETRLVHMGDPHLAAQRLRIAAEGWAGEVRIESGPDGRVRNDGVERYRDLNGRHLTGLEAGFHPPDTVSLSCRTASSDIRVALACRTRVTSGRPREVAHAGDEERPVLCLTVPVGPGRPVTVEKVVALHTSRDTAIGNPLDAALSRAARAGGFGALLGAHTAAWHRLWRRAGSDVPGRAGHVLRLHQFHVLQTLSSHTAGLDVGVPARGLHGEAYRGHVFWDELFVLPYLDLHLPEVSRALLMYRYRRLGAACRAAADAGRVGAMYPWQSGSDGREETQRLHLNPRSGRWLPDRSRLQHHVGSAVAYNVWHYYQASGDTAFLHAQGAEMLFRIARFWAHTARWDAAYGRYRITGIVGPDEYHDAYPGAAGPGIDDNAYTNVTAAWVLCRAREVAGMLPAPRRDELFERTAVDSAELERWEDVSRRLRVPFHQGVISQFEGYGELAELDWAAYRARYGDIRRLDRILEAEGDSTNRYQASKQADVLMLGYLFPRTELAALMARLGHRLDEETWTATVDHYLARTSHGSTLSELVHGWVLARCRRAEAWSYVQESLLSDVADLQGGTTGEGIHLGAMGGTLDLVQRGLTGLEPRGGALLLDPAPLPEMTGMSPCHLSLRYQGHWDVELSLHSGHLRVRVPDSDQGPVRLVMGGRTHLVRPGTEATIPLPPTARRGPA